MMNRKYGGFLVNPQQAFPQMPGVTPGFGGNYGQQPFPVQSNDQRRAELEALGAQNIQGDLPYSPRLKSRKDGTLHYWSHVFAMQPALFANCDENGNEDPTAWYGRTPAAWRGVGEPNLKALHRVRMTKQGVTETKSQAEEFKELGISPEYIPDFSVGVTQGGNAFGGVQNYQTVNQANQAMLAAEMRRGE